MLGYQRESPGRTERPNSADFREAHLNDSGANEYRLLPAVETAPAGQITGMTEGVA
jgi:hypothetical protein